MWGACASEGHIGTQDVFPCCSALFLLSLSIESKPEYWACLSDWREIVRTNRCNRNSVSHSCSQSISVARQVLVGDQQSAP